MVRWAGRTRLRVRPGVCGWAGAGRSRE
jgi:hypothetical protein